ncbi:MAG: hypothetical protein HYT48_01540 [Candidatus Vogelbacteria bacterium]|nr:hypothetical protein [Candidatus Vogelbacteria bacterium]
MAIVGLCGACKEGQHGACQDGTGGELGPNDEEMDGLLFCCTCEICAKERPIKAMKKELDQVAANLSGATSLRELWHKLHDEVARIGQKL